MDEDQISLQGEGEIDLDGTENVNAEMTTEKDEIKNLIKQNSNIMASVMQLIASNNRKRKRSASSSPSSSSSSPSLATSKTKRAKNKSIELKKGKAVMRSSRALGQVDLDQDWSGDESILDAIGEMASGHNSDPSQEGAAHTGKHDTSGAETEVSDEMYSDKDDWYKEATEEYEIDEEVGEPIEENLVKFIEKTMTEPMKDVKLKDKIQRYKRPRNCPALTVRRTNKPIWTLLNKFQRKRDMKLVGQQKNTAKAVTAIAKSAEIIKQMAKSTKNENNMQNAKQAVKALTDAMSILGHAQQNITWQRKESQKPAIPFESQGICDMVSDGYDLLFGEEVERKMKEAREQKRLTSSFHASQRKRRGHFLGRGSHRGAPQWSNHKRRGQANYAPRGPYKTANWSQAKRA